MGKKRKASEAEADEIPPITSAESKAEKKDKKKHKKEAADKPPKPEISDTVDHDATSAGPTNGDAPLDQPAEKKEKGKKDKKEKKEKKDKKDKKRDKKKSEEAGESEPVTSEKEKESSQQRKERKKAARKEAKKAAANGEGANGTITESIVTKVKNVALVDGDAVESMEVEETITVKEVAGEDKMDVDSSDSSPPADSGKSSKAEKKAAKSNGTAPQTLANITDTSSYMETHSIKITDPKAPDAKSFDLVLNFSDLPAVDKSHLSPFSAYKTPTPIQAASWSHLLAGRDLIGVAETGSGKTMAFAYPAVQYLSKLPKSERNPQKTGAKVVIVSPTRELAMQIYEQTEVLTKAAGLKDAATCIYGGVPKDPQRESLKKALVIVATPGRLNDFLEEGAANISRAGYVVLDEADRMLDKGFEDAIKTILGATPATPKRQTLMFTATWPQSVRQLASTFMTQPVRIGINSPDDGDLRANTRIAQSVEVLTDPRAKESRLLNIINAHQRSSQAAKNDRILVFALYKKEAARLEGFLRAKGIKVGGIHGDLNQHVRTATLAEFKAGRTPVLVATDVAARGLDIPNVKLVINVTFPLTIEDYVHRIGRTGRAGELGKAITFFTDHDKAHSGSLINVLKAASQPVPEELMKFGTTVKKKEHASYGAFYRDTGDSKQATKIKFDD
ncbi:hypothetical protein DRE_04189 [Drechslerella stenobrocha 248]|uniref:RNA helicase n=1 Tax=Drechslerella stenobrocha 248 TaxID=1043628 RepID=W7HR44_9PEZI|nr:hypothetical protein DRE_04189 [Drechslerella stenobrocha 248]